MSTKDYYSELEPAISKVSVLIDKYRSNPNIKICLYLGIKNDNEPIEYGFNCEDFYNKVKGTLNKPTWDNTFESCYDMYSVTDPCIFIEYYSSKGYIYKKKILHEYTFSYKNTPFDFQVLVFECTEIKKMPMDISENGKYSFHNYCLRNSVVGIYQCEINMEEHIEIEQGLIVTTNDLDKTENSSKYIAHDLLLRLRDIINICEPINNAILVLLSEYN